MLKLTLTLIEELLREQAKMSELLARESQKDWESNSTIGNLEALDDAAFHRGYATGISAGANEVQRLKEVVV